MTLGYSVGKHCQPAALEPISTPVAQFEPETVYRIGSETEEQPHGNACHLPQCAVLAALCTTVFGP